MISPFFWLIFFHRKGAKYCAEHIVLSAN